MRIDSSGRVGIGVTPNAFSSTGGSLSIGSQGNIGNGYKVGSLNFITGDSTFTGNYPDGITGEIASVSEGAAGARYDMVFLTADGDGSNSRGERMRIDSSGVSKFIPTKAYGDTSSNLKIFGAFTGSNYSDGSYFNLVFGDDDATNSYMGSITVKQLNASSSTATEMLFYTNAGGGNGAVNPNMVIDSSGNVGIGNTNPSQKLTVSGNAYISGGLLLLDDNQPIQWGNSQQKITGNNSGYLQFITSGSEAMRIDSSGAVTGIITDDSFSDVDQLILKRVWSTSSSGDRSHGIAFKDANSTMARIYADRVNSASNYASHLVFITNDGTTGTDTSEKMRLTNGGNLLVGATSTPSSSVSGIKLSNPIDGAALYSSGTTTTNVNQIAFINGNGTVGTIATSGSSTTYSTSSDYRLKENVVPMEGALDRVDSLKPSRFNFIADADKTVDGFLAHEVAEVVPEAITGEKDAVDEEGNAIYQGIDQSKLVPLLVGAIQELKAEIETLKSQIQ
jgi:hypothetical protein